MDLTLSIVKLVYIVGLIFFLVYSVLTIIVLWRFSLSHSSPIIMTAIYALGAGFLIVSGLLTLFSL